jgi:hypothetical protein
MQPVLSDKASMPTTVSQAKLRMFSGATFRDVIQLHWITTSEEGTVGFEIERRSQLSNDWQMIGYLRRARLNTPQHSYSFLDQLRGDGVSYYRLRQIGMDGSATVSPVVTVTPDEVPRSFHVWQHSIKPFQNYGTVSFGLEADADVKLSLVDRFGKTVATLLDHAPMRAGHHVIPFGTYTLKPGLYILRITSAEGIRNLLLMNS